MELGVRVKIGIEIGLFNIVLAFGRLSRNGIRIANTTPHKWSQSKSSSPILWGINEELEL